MDRKVFALALFILLALTIGCSNNGEAPVVPDNARTSTALDSHRLMGLYQFTADPAEGTLDYTQLRIADLHLNALPFLEPPALLYLSLESLQFNGNLIEANIGLRHPFLGLSEFSGFDVCGILISDGSIGGFDNAGIFMPGPDNCRLMNPDGYSRWWNPSEFPSNGTIFGYTDGLLGTQDSVADFSATLNGYKYFCDDLDDPDDPLTDVTLENRGLFSAGQKNVRHYTIDITSGLVFNYAVDASWQFPQGDPPWSVPEDFAPEANRPEAWNAVITESDNDLWNDGAESGGGISLQMDVYDWYGAPLNIVTVESPGNFASVQAGTPTGGGEGYSTYEVEILDATPAEGSIDIIICAESEDVGYGGLLPGEPVTAYFGYTAAVSDEKPPDVIFPVMIDSGKSYYATRFVEDSNGVFHVAASWIESSTQRELRWFISTDDGATWQSKGDICNAPSIEGAYAPPLAFQLAADSDGGVYMLYGEGKDYSGGPIVSGFLKYLDTNTAGQPSDWDTSDWLSKKVFTVDPAVGAQSVALAISPTDQILMMLFDWRYCNGPQGLKYNFAPGGWVTVVDGTAGLGVDNSLVSTGTGDMYYMYPSGNNNLVYHPTTGHFFYCIGGSFSFEGSGENVGVCALEFDPNVSSNAWEMVAAFQNPGMGNSGSIMQNYHGDLAVDSDGNVHWVHASTYRYWTEFGYNYNNVQFRFVHGVRDNTSGVWDMTDTPINGTWDFPTPPPTSSGDINNRIDNEPAYINLVHTTNGILLSWLQSCTYPNYQSSLLQPGGAFSDPPEIQLAASEYPILHPSTLAATNSSWMGAQGEAVGNKLALPFACKEVPTDARGQLWFTMFTDM